MDRRGFIRLGIAGVGTTIAAPRLVLADVADSPMAGGLYHTAEAPGRWSGKAGSHLPIIEVAKQAQGATIEVVTPHPVDGYRHYIVKHLVLDKNFKFVAEHMFDPMQEPAVRSEFSLGAYSGVIYVLSVCNQHDSWLIMAEI